MVYVLEKSDFSVLVQNGSKNMTNHIQAAPLTKVENFDLGERFDTDHQPITVELKKERSTKRITKSW